MLCCPKKTCDFVGQNIADSAFNFQISLVIEAGQLKLTMETGNAGLMSVSSIYIVNDGLQHVAVVSFGVGFIQMQVDDDLVNLRSDENQPGLPQVKKHIQRVPVT